MGRRLLSELTVAAGLAFLFACAGPQKRPTAPAVETPKPPQAARHAPRELIVIVPQTDETAIQSLKAFDHAPKLRMVLVLSPSLKKFAQDAALRNRALELQKAGRLEIALQLPNPPFLPLIVDSQAAKEAVPAGTPLPETAFAFPDDVTHLVARAKAEFFRTWRFLPHGLALPYGAASPALLNVLDKQGFAWCLASLEAPAVDGPYKAGSSLHVWDATPSLEPVGTQVRLWDERTMKERGRNPLAAWAQALEASDRVAILPSDPVLVPTPLSTDVRWLPRSWTTRDWTPWIGTPRKNQAWSWLQRARAALETYKNSGHASVQHLDLAFEEMFAAENATYVMALDNPSVSIPAADERERELQAALTTIYRLMDQAPPQDLFTAAAATTAVRAVPASARSQAMPDGTEYVLIEDPTGDGQGNGQLGDPPNAPAGTAYDLTRLEIWGSSDAVRFQITLASAPAVGWGRPGNPGPIADVYIDQNHQPNVGTQSFFAGRRLQSYVTDAWEFAFTINATQAQLFRTTGSTSYEEVYSTVPTVDGAVIRWSVPRTALRGSPRRWSYQALMLASNPNAGAAVAPWVIPGSKIPPVFDLLDVARQPQAAFLGDAIAGKGNDLPFIRPRAE